MSLCPVHGADSLCPPALEVQPRVHRHHDQVGEKAGAQADKGEHVEGAEHYRVVALQGGLEAQESQTVDGENGFHNDAAGKEDAHEGGREARNDQEHSVSEDVAPENAALGISLGSGGYHVLFIEFFQEVVFGKNGKTREAADGKGKNGQGEMPEVIENFGARSKLVPVLGDQTAQGEEVEETAPREEHDKNNGEEKAGNGAAHADGRGGPEVEGGTLLDGLSDAQGNGDAVDNKKGPQAQGDGDRQPGAYQAHYRIAPEEAVAEIEAQEIPEHFEVAFVQGFIEAEAFFNGGDDFGVQADRSAVSPGAGGGIGILKGGGFLGAPAADAFHTAVSAEPLGFGNSLLHRSAGGHLNDDEIDRNDGQQGGRNKQKTAGQIPQH